MPDTTSQHHLWSAAVPVHRGARLSRLCQDGGRLNRADGLTSMTSNIASPMNDLMYQISKLGALEGKELYIKLIITVAVLQQALFLQWSDWHKVKGEVCQKCHIVQEGQCMYHILHIFCKELPLQYFLLKLNTLWHRLASYRLITVFTSKSDKTWASLSLGK